MENNKKEYTFRKIAKKDLSYDVILRTIENMGIGLEIKITGTWIPYNLFRSEFSKGITGKNNGKTIDSVKDFFDESLKPSLSSYGYLQP